MSNKIVRVYPIRMTRKSWEIPLFCFHKCGKHCRIIIVPDNLEFLIMENKYYVDGQCQNYMNLERTIINMSLFNFQNPRGINGYLYNHAMKVIPDNSFTLSIHYPLTHSLEVTIQASELQGFNLTELIYSIKMLYEFIYQEEERTSNPHSYRLKKSCSDCKVRDIKDYINIVKSPSDECCICYSNYKKDKAGMLNCKHTFHTKCIKKWLETSVTCPLCRDNVFSCEDCDGSGIINYIFHGVVIPYDERGDNLYRNLTDGLFGIHSLDFEELVISHMFYDRCRKRLEINVQ
jgi:hypothetical protein